MKRVIFLLLLFSFSLTVCFGQDIKEYLSEDYGFSVEYPGDWRLVENQQVQVQDTTVNVPFMAVAPLDSVKQQFPATVNIILEPLEQDLTARQYLDLNVANIKNSFQIIRFSKPKPYSLTNGMEGYLLSYTIKGKVKIEQYIFFYDKRGIVITTISVQNKFWKYKKVFKQILNSFNTFDSGGV